MNSNVRIVSFTEMMWIIIDQVLMRHGVFKAPRRMTVFYSPHCDCPEWQQHALFEKYAYNSWATIDLNMEPCKWIMPLN